jgi:cell migration-inducing and hyaluronan-binding protein
VSNAGTNLNLTLTEMDKGSWVIFQLPGFNTAAPVTRQSATQQSLTQQTSLYALRTASDTSYFKDKDALWVKVVSNGDGARGPRGNGPGVRTSLQVSR